MPYKPQYIEVHFRRGLGYSVPDTVVSIATLSLHSHAELYIDGWSYSATMKEGVRKVKGKRLNDGTWDVYRIRVTSVQKRQMLQFFEATKGLPYDYLGVIFFIWMPFSIQCPKKYYCFEWVFGALRAGFKELVPPFLPNVSGHALRRIVKDLEKKNAKYYGR
jgi:uncharacterized protein YycO